MSMTKARLKQAVEVNVPHRVAAVLEGTAAGQGCSVGTVAETVLSKWAAMVEAAGPVENWKAVPVDAETNATIRDYAAELGDAETLHLDTALMIFFDQAANTKRKLGHY